jgi:putative membrane protein
VNSASVRIADEAPATVYDTESNHGKLNLQNNCIILNDDNFASAIQEIYENMNQYEGKRIELTGFVYKNNMIQDNEFVPARMLMWCCSADLQTIGLLCRYDNAPALKQTAWVKVSGLIKVVDYRGQKTPVIYADQVVNTDKPQDEYVYP